MLCVVLGVCVVFGVCLLFLCVVVVVCVVVCVCCCVCVLCCMGLFGLFVVVMFWFGVCDVVFAFAFVLSCLVCAFGLVWCDQVYV